MTVTLYSMHYIRRTHHMLKRTLLNGPHAQPLMQDAETGAYHPVYDYPGPDRYGPEQHLTFQEISDMYPSTWHQPDDWHSTDIEDDGFLEQLDRSAESVHFP